MTETTTDPAVELVPLTLLASELVEDVQALADRLGDHVVSDDIGFRCVPAEVATSAIVARDELLAEHRRTAERNAASLLAVTEQHRSPIRGIPAIEGMTVFETMLSNAAADPEFKPARVSPHQEFLDNIGRPQ